MSWFTTAYLLSTCKVIALYLKYYFFGRVQLFTQVRGRKALSRFAKNQRLKPFPTFHGCYLPRLNPTFRAHL